MSGAIILGATETGVANIQLTGIHHLTAITANALARFDTETPGLRLVKKTVNQDDTSAYRLFYADDRRRRAPISPFSTARPTCRRAAIGPHDFRSSTSPIPARSSATISARSISTSLPGVLFEIATGGPAFTVDESLESLGERKAVLQRVAPSLPAVRLGRSAKVPIGAK
ncbi:hypothetical protein MES4922_20196 [Mesorhizobium ventifaucium]|uniref:Uncharacterized protein n=1 Tax=Mesorhizobium ventifaucium TaxID=666020 RepID=A0ABM9DR73_9HYPH|nr:hypothetical protein MES4922_20196 [Mesorhizobium ventifaucium]